MEYVAFIFAIFGFMAYLQISQLKKRIDELERQLTKMHGTSFHEERKDLLQAAKAYIGEHVRLEMKEDHQDIDAVMYGNTKHGTITILDADEEWMLVRMETPRGTKEKLLRMESIERIGAVRGE